MATRDLRAKRRPAIWRPRNRRELWLWVELFWRWRCRSGGCARGIARRWTIWRTFF